MVEEYIEFDVDGNGKVYLIYHNMKGVDGDFSSSGNSLSTFAAYHLKRKLDNPSLKLVVNSGLAKRLIRQEELRSITKTNRTWRE